MNAARHLTARVVNTAANYLDGLLNGDLAQVEREDRDKLIAWQERRTRIGLHHMFQLLTLVASAKVGLVCVGIWPVPEPATTYLAAWALMGLVVLVNPRVRTLASESLVAVTFVLAFVVILVDASGAALPRPGTTLGGLLLLPVIGIPLLVRLSAAAIFSLFCVLLVLGYFMSYPTLIGDRFSISLYLAVALVAGFKLRRLRTNMSIGYLRSMESAVLKANTDSLTGLLSRAGWMSAAEASLQAAATSDRRVCLLFIDLDHFKQLNDQHGHQAGDDALRRTGRALKSRLDESSIAGRVGGEEFVCLLPGVSMQKARRFAERLQRDLAVGVRPLTFSGGLVQWIPGESVSELMARGDEAMYGAKKSGRNCVVAG